jgi:hypothetical protein
LVAARVFVAVTVRVPPAETELDAVAELGVGLQVNTISWLFHQNSNGGAKIVCITIDAAVKAGSREFPITGFLLKLSLLQKLMLSWIVRVTIGILCPIQVVDESLQLLKAIFYAAKSAVTRVA